MSVPDLSVVVPAFNEELFLPACLESLFKQEFPGTYEVVVVDNNSTDRTAAIAKGLGARVVHEPLVGVVPARQCGTLEAQADIVVSTDADTTFEPGWLRNIYRAFGNDESIVAVTGPWQFETHPWWGRRYSNMVFRITNFFYARSGKVVYAGASNLAFRKSAWSAIGGYNTALTQGGDENDLLKRLAKQGRILYLHHNLVHTSSRRTARGLLYNLFVTVGLYYFLDYFILSRFTGRSVFGQWAAFREPIKTKSRMEKKGEHPAP